MNKTTIFPCKPAWMLSLLTFKKKLALALFS